MIYVTCQKKKESPEMYRVDNLEGMVGIYDLSLNERYR